MMLERGGGRIGRRRRSSRWVSDGRTEMEKGTAYIVKTKIYAQVREEKAYIVNEELEVDEELYVPAIINKYGMSRNADKSIVLFPLLP